MSRDDEQGLGEVRRSLFAARSELLRRGLERQRETRKGGGGVSRGPGRCQRAVIAELESAPGGTMTRRQLEEALVKQGFSGSNVLRAVRGLKRRWLLELREGSDLDTSIVALPPPQTPVSDARIFRLLAELAS